MSEIPSNPFKANSRSFDRGTREPARLSSEADEKLLARIRSKDPRAMTDLFDRYSGMVFSVALRVLKDPAHAEDVMQEVFFQIWDSPKSFVSDRGSLGAWLAVVARNRAIDTLRRRKPSDAVEDVVLVSSTNLASEVERRSMMEKVRTILIGLPTEQQQSIELAFFDGLSHSEIAAQTGDPLGTVKTRIRSALITVRKAMQA